MRHLLLACAAVILAAGCEKVESTSVKTSGVYADLAATSYGEGTTEVEATLKVGGPLANVYLDLAGGDHLTARAGGHEADLDRLSFGDMVWYKVELPVDAGGTEIILAFTRPDDVSTESRVTLPQDLAPAVTGAGPFSRSLDDVVIGWGGGSDDDVTVDLAGDCILAYGAGGGVDTGSVRIPGGILTAPSPAAPATCTVTATITRERRAAVDPAFGEGGQFVARQVRAVTFASVP
jgi:hypothetical protein